MSPRYATIPPGLNLRYEVDGDGCHIWVGCLDPNGYGRVGNHSGTYLAHRVAYTYAVGPIETRQLDHLCRNRACINPTHLEPVTNAKNTRRGDKAILTWADVIEARLLRMGGWTYPEIGRHLGVSDTCAHDAVNGRRWSAA